MPVGIRFQKNGETEVVCSLALLKDLIETGGSRFLALLVFDALYLQTPFTAEVEALGLDWVGNLKENQPELLAEAQRVTAGAPEVHSQDQDELQLWHAPEVYWPVAHRTIRVVKTVRHRTNKRRRVPRG